MSQHRAPHNSTDDPPTYLTASIIALLLIIVFVIGLFMFPPVFEAAKDAPKPADSVLFVGRFHPIVVHLPVGALMLLVLFELACLSRKNEERYGPAALLTLLVGAAGSVAAVLVGIMLSREGGYEGGNYTLHQAIGIGGTSGILLALMIRISAMRNGHGGLMDCYRILFVLSLAFISVGAHFGGNMSHGSKFLTEFAPPSIAAPMTGFEKWMLGLVSKPKSEDAEPKSEPPAPATEIKKEAPTVAEVKTNPPEQSAPPTSGGITADDSVLVFQNVILPILEAKCNKCHCEEKSKGDLRMDTHALLLKGGKDETNKTVLPGKPEESLAIMRIKLPVDDDDHMPPEGKDQMTADETALLHWWIQEGASGTQKVKDAKFPEKIKPLVESLLKK